MLIKYHKTKDENIKDLYISIKRRIGKQGLYKKRKLLIEYKDFYDFLIKNKQYNRIYKEWVNNDFYYVISPSIDRIDNNGDYTLENIQVLTRLQNIRKGQGNGEIKEPDVKYFILERRNELIVMLKHQGFNNSAIAEMFNLNRSTVKRVSDFSMKLEEKKHYKKLSDELKS